MVARKKRKPAGRGRPALKETVKATWINGGNTVRFVFSEDMVAKLREFHMSMFSVFYTGGLVRPDKVFDPYKAIRLEFMQFSDLSIPAVFVRIEPPTYDPKGHRLWRAKNGRRFFAQTPVKPIGVKPGQETVTLEHLFEESSPQMLGGGMLLIFPDDYMVFPGRKNRKVFKQKTPA